MLREFLRDDRDDLRELLLLDLRLELLLDLADLDELLALDLDPFLDPLYLPVRLDLYLLDPRLDGEDVFDLLLLLLELLLLE